MASTVSDAIQIATPDWVKRVSSPETSIVSNKDHEASWGWSMLDSLGHEGIMGQHGPLRQVSRSDHAQATIF
jgi:hypothetical protein